MNEVDVHHYEYDEKASSSTRIVTICHHCGKTEVKELMDMWTQPPSHWVPMQNSHPNLPRNITLN